MMNLERELVFCFIEEDNTQRAYFRVRPLLTVNGDVQEDARRLWPDDGCLRIVPDRNEQHTFKDRMRTLGGYCMMNLRGIPADANKIRTNKNYKPDKGESNQFILYSDTVQALPEHTFFEVLEGAAADHAALAQKAVTPLFYIRQEDTLYGPVKKAAPIQPETAGEAAGVLYPLTCPDNTERVLLCIDQPLPVKQNTPAAVPAPIEADESLPIGKPLQILDQSKDFKETLQSLDQPLSSGANLLHQPEEKPVPAPMNDKPLSGTPLYRANMHTSVPQPKNKLQEVVSAQWRVARNEPPTAPLPAGARMRQVENPVEVACTSMRTAWQVPEAQTQLMDFILSLDGMRAKLDAHLSSAAEQTPLQKALHARLEDMEAERLSILLQLDKAKADLEGYRRSVAEQLTGKAREELTRLQQETEQHKAALTALKALETNLLAQRDELTRRISELQHSDLPAALAKALADAQLAAPVAGTPLHLAPVTGCDATDDELIRRVTDALAASGIQARRNHAVAILALLGVCRRIGLTAPSAATASTLAGNVAARMGWSNSYAHQVTPEQKPLLSPAPADATPAVLLTSLAAYAPLHGVTKVFLARSALNMIRNPAYEADPWPILSLPVLPAVPLLASGAAHPVAAAALQRFASQSAAAPEEIARVLAPIMQHVPPLSGAALQEMQRFIGVCSAAMEGGFASACDWAIALWLIPLVDRNVRTVGLIKPLLEEYPMALSLL